MPRMALRGVRMSWLMLARELALGLAGGLGGLGGDRAFSSSLAEVHGGGVVLKDPQGLWLSGV